MPQAVLIPIGNAVAVAIGASFYSTAAIAALGAATIVVGAAAIRALTPKPNLGKATGYTLTQRGAAVDHQVVYGKTRVAGAEVFKATTGTDNAYLHMVLAFSGHEIESFEEIWINDEKATLDGNGNVTTVTAEDGSTSGRYNNKMTIIKRLGGTDNATAVSFGSSPNRPTDAGWTTDHKLTGISFLYVRLKFDRDAYPNGVPEIQATIKGKKVYDPRTATTAWSDNPALCIRDYLTESGYGLGESSDAIDDTLFVNAANACDEASDYSDTKTIWGSSVTLGQKKFTLNGSFTTAANPVDILEDMLTSMGGTLWYAQGKWRTKAAKWTAPVLTLNEDDLRSSVTVSTRHATRDNFNVIKGTFKGIESNYIETDYEQFPLDDSTNSFIQADGEQKNPVDIPLPFTGDHVTARRLARIALESHRQQIQVSASFGMKAFQLQVGDVVRITNSRFGWSAKEFEVLTWSFSMNDDLQLIVDMNLQETAESVFDEEDDGAIYERDNTTLLSPFDVPTVTLGTPTSGSTVNRDGTVVPFIEFSWSASDPSRVGHYLVEWSNDAGVNYTSVTTDSTSYRLSPAESGTSYLYRVTPYNYLGVSGSTVTSGVSTPTVNDGTTPNAPSIVSISGGYRTATVDWNEPTQNTDGSDLTDLRYYRVYRGTSSNPTTEIGVTYSSIFTDGGLADNTTYYYRIKAVDTSGNESAYSVQDSVTTNPELVDGADGADGADGDDGPRGAGRWHVGVTTLPTTSSGADTEFTAALGNPVDRDQAWFYTGTIGSPTGQSVWIYSSTGDTWNEQEEVIDGDLLVTGTVTTDAIATDAITAAKIDVTDLSAISANLGTIEVDTANIANGAVTNRFAAFTAADLTPTTSYQLLQELTIDCDGNPISILFNAGVDGITSFEIDVRLDDVSQRTFNTSSGFYVEPSDFSGSVPVSLFGNTGNTFVTSVPSSHSHTVSLSGTFSVQNFAATVEYYENMATIAMTVTPSAGSRTVKVYGRKNGGQSSSPTVRNRYLETTELKR